MRGGAAAGGIGKRESYGGRIEARESWGENEGKEEGRKEQLVSQGEGLDGEEDAVEEEELKVEAANC